MAGHKRGPRFKDPDEPRLKKSRVSVLDRARILDVYRRCGDLKQLTGGGPGHQHKNSKIDCSYRQTNIIKAALEEEMPGVTISTSTVDCLLDAHSYSVKLVTHRPADRNRDDVTSTANLPCTSRICLLSPNTRLLQPPARFLSGFPATRRVRVNYQRNLVAVDTHQASDPTSLLQVAVICDVKVRSKILTTNTCVGLVFGVDPRFDAEAISANICSSVPVTSCVRRGKCLTITFEGTTVPKEIFLYKQRRLVRPRLPRPLQCTRCGRYGHATATCSLDERCLRCGASHAAEPCTAEQPRCVNCNGNHASTDPRCSSWQLQRKAAVILASSDGSVTRRQALERAGNVVRNKQGTSVVTKGRSFRDALTGGCASTTAEPTPSTTSAPAPQADPKDVVLAALVAAIRAVLPFVPDDSPVRALCAAALAAHDVIAPTG
ncbi:hypothetical protein HPB52_019454 [Rhipicephalus sanguineus]|uniref:CCHC-type domain-containing protein n=1 Tax=Rhipicephalus sanguineus TaxID=34632 RepID=A0A9D4TBH7_RHISA|nr:hypothetical protein HPB52_019454 [Rhipicephalus sanguineus]